MKHPHQLGIGIRGYARVDVINHLGEVVRSIPKQKNLLLDRGMDRIATTVFANLFRYCAKGTGTTATTEAVDGANTYSQASLTVTRTAGTRDFSADDAGKLFKFSGGAFAKVTAYTNATHVEVDRVNTITDENIVLFSVNQDALDNETHRTGTVSSTTGHNGTTDASNVRTLKRTFVLDPETGSGAALDGTFSKATNVVTRASGTNVFTSANVGDSIVFDDDDAEYRITAYTSATVVEVNEGATTHSAQAVTLYAKNTYNEIAFGDSAIPNDPINIRIALASPVNAAIPTPTYPGEQVRVEYSLEIAVSPGSITPGTAPITDPGNIMSSVKDGDYVIEQMSLSRVNADGTTDLSDSALEPATPGYLGISPQLQPLDPFSGPSRITGAVLKALTPVAYVDGDYFKVFAATFNTLEAIGSAWRSIGIFNAPNRNTVFTFLFDSNQNKSNSMSLTVRFKKTWDRDL